MAVTGFDDIPMARHVHPLLTTVRQPIGDLGETAFEVLYTMIGREAPAERDIALPTRLMCRETCGCLADSAGWRASLTYQLVRHLMVLAYASGAGRLARRGPGRRGRRRGCRRPGRPPWPARDAGRAGCSQVNPMPPSSWTRSWAAVTAASQQAELGQGHRTIGVSGASAARQAAAYLEAAAASVIAVHRSASRA